MVLYSTFTDGFQFSREKTGCNSVAWFTSYNNFRDTVVFRCFFWNALEVEIRLIEVEAKLSLATVLLLLSATKHCIDLKSCQNVNWNELIVWKIVTYFSLPLATIILWNIRNEICQSHLFKLILRIQRNVSWI